MKPVVAIVALLAVLAAGATALLAQRWVAGLQAARPVTAEAAPAPTAEVLVVARDVAAGVALGDDDLAYEAWPSAPAQRFIARTAADDPKARFIGAVPRRALAAGEPFQENAVARPDAGVLAMMLEAGMRAVSVPITAESGASGFINPGDRVDVVLAADFQRADDKLVGQGGKLVRFASETVLADVKVLAIDQQFTRDDKGAAIVGKTAAIAVTPKQAEILAAAALLGHLSLALRPQVRAETAPEPAREPPAFTADVEASQAMRALTRGGRGGGGAVVTINRAGEISERKF